MEIPERHKGKIFWIALFIGAIIMGVWFVYQPVVKAEGYMWGKPAPEPEEVEEPASPDVVTKGHETKVEPQCPRTLLHNKHTAYHVCTNCHVNPTWEIKEVDPDVGRDYPNTNMRIRGDTLIYKVHLGISYTALDDLEEALEYLEWHPEVKKIEIEILSGGGHMFVAWQMISKLEAAKKNYHVTTIVPGFAASAAFMLFCAGDERLVYDNSILMHHELWSFEFLKVEDVSGAEENARVKRLFQDNIHDYLIKRSILTKEQLDEYIKGERDYWMTGSDALEVGFATGLM